MGERLHYRIGQILPDGRVWYSSISEGGIFAADDDHTIWKALLAGFLMKSARWAETVDGELMFGLDPHGMRVTREYPVPLVKLRASHLAKFGLVAHVGDY